MMSVRQSKKVGEIELHVFVFVFCFGRSNHDRMQQPSDYIWIIYRILLDLHLADFFRQASCCKASQGDAYGSKVVEMLLSLGVSLLDVAL